ncbi:MAG: putative Holliday junction resolvase [Rhodospirillaceae bacterium]|nr:MAG: putative Holliday junction resolvase [Rhodospirillaceae bacterium]
MTIRNLLQLKALLKPGQPLLGLDLGHKTLGLALSDVSLTVATPLGVVERQSLVKDIGALIRAMHAHDVGGLVIGLPLQMDGTEGTQAAATRAFVLAVLQRVDVEIAFWDERLSSVAVERMLITEADLSRKRRKAVLDRAAAAYILQGVLDYLANVAA